MPTYIFASQEKPDFESQGRNVSEAFQSLVHRERETGNLHKLYDLHRNKTAVELEGFECFEPGNFEVVYKFKSSK